MSSRSLDSLERELRLCGLIHDKGTPRNAEASADVQYSLRLNRDHLNDREDPFAVPPWWRHPRLGDEDYLQELLYGDAPRSARPPVDRPSHADESGR
ncbi:hypothetical protein ACIBH1_44905 [Nonomuraea sp. NPDC050663]|uniref:hypothetical protein n=1 Tax=Nonomuraea sp. NPDC050663 TaxID=3364370 RepID=UPI003789D15F